MSLKYAGNDAGHIFGYVYFHVREKINSEAINVENSSTKVIFIFRKTDNIFKTITMSQRISVFIGGGEYKKLK